MTAPTGGGAAVAHAAEAGTFWRPGAPCTPRTCVERAARTRALPWAVLRLTALLVLLATGATVRLVTASLGIRLPPGPVRRWCRWVVRAAGVRVRIGGEAVPAAGVLIVARHVSWLDVPLLAAVRPARMLAKSEIRSWPVAGRLAARGGALFIDRDRIRALPGTVARVAGHLRSGHAVAVFPEGSTWCGRAGGPFRPAAFQAALDADVPVVPVRLRYRVPGGPPATVPAFVGDDTLARSVWRVVRARGLSAEAEVRAPLLPGPRTDRRTLARAAETETGASGDAVLAGTAVPAGDGAPRGGVTA
ncbi:lysophospholipid acyltransferase family protein [Streptomyces sp. NPDC059374]|uniref:lysophospholipid acyltransferase family protein n=1 Tax=Streptomyces sp. NPDC059374 TaxID=3346814 RepID=UPI0036788E8D